MRGVGKKNGDGNGVIVIDTIELIVSLYIVRSSMYCVTITTISLYNRLVVSFRYANATFIVFGFGPSSLTMNHTIL